VISDPARPEAPATAIFMEGSFASIVTNSN